MRKIYLALVCMASLAIVTACGGGNASKDNATPTADGEAVEEVAAEGQAPADNSLAGTTWKCRAETPDDKEISYYDYEISFTADGKSTWSMTGYDKSGNVDSSVSDKLSGTYTFEDERGTLDYGKRVDPGKIWLTPDGKLHVDVRYESQDYTKVE